MARFYFNTMDGEAVADAEGVELPGRADAQVEAVRLMGELLREHAPEFWVTRNFSLTVTDEAGVALFMIMTSGAHVPTRGHVADQTGG